MAKRLALLIGQTAYQDGRLIAPHGGGRDVAALAAALRDPQHGRFDHVITLADKTAVDTQLAIAAFLEQNLNPDDLILLYFAGHCLLTPDDIYLATADTFTETYLDATTIQADFIKRRLKYCPAQAVVVVDGVYSSLEEGHAPDAARLFRRAFSGVDWVTLLTTAPAPLAAPSAFTGALAEGLRHLAADADDDGRLTVREWFDYAQAQLAAPAEKWATAAQEEWAVTAVSPAKLTPLVPIARPLNLEIATPEPAPLTATSTDRRNLGIAALVVLMLLMVGGLYALNNGFGGDPPEQSVASPPSPTSGTAVVAVQDFTATPDPSPTVTPGVTVVMSATAVVTAPVITATVTPATATATLLAPSPTATATATPTAVTPTVTTTPTDTPTPTITPTPSATPTPLPMEIVAQTAFLRDGPGINYKIIAFPTRGTAVTAVGRNSEATWYNVILPDGGRGWLYTDVVRPADAEAGVGLPVAATIPAPINEFYNFVAQDTGATLITQVYHVYEGARGETAYLRARLLPETDQVRANYLNGTQLGLGLLIVEFSHTGSVAYSSADVEFCMVDATGDAFHCQTFPARKDW
jgi:hypothetical protein